MTQAIWLGLSPGAKATRILAMRGPRETILKAQLSLRPSRPQAVSALLEAISLWEGVPVRAALAVDDGSIPSHTTSLYEDTFAMFDEQTPLYSFQWVRRAEVALRRRDDIGGMGNFDDLKRLLARSVAR